MRLKLSLAVLALLAAGNISAMAQTTTQTTTGTGSYYTGPNIYNSTSNPYYNTTNGANPIYNNGTNTPIIPMQQMIAGKNAPSYNYNTGNTGAYNTYGANPMARGSIGSMSPEQANYMRAQRDAQAQAYQQDYINQRQQQLNQQQALNGSSAYQGTAFSNLYANGDQQKPPVKKVVQYKKQGIAPSDPPRLFNPDQ